MQLFYEPSAIKGEFTLNKEEAIHCLKVLRKRINDIINVVDGCGTFYSCKIVSDDPKKCHLVTLDTSKENKRHVYLHVAIAPTKSIDRMEWFVEKAIEIGIEEITFLNCYNSERKFVKIERLKKKAISAMKQSLKASLPTINTIQDFESFVLSDTSTNSKYIAHVDSMNPNTLFNEKHQGEPVIIMIGPEGDFSSNEVEFAIKNGFKKVSLGNSRLRTETAGIIACSVYYY